MDKLQSKLDNDEKYLYRFFAQLKPYQGLGTGYAIKQLSVFWGLFVWQLM
ncbi:MAG: hypothetical protein WBA13_05585 [Microcoleaceae cyanobacterium]